MFPSAKISSAAITANGLNVFVARADGEIGTGWTYSPCDVGAMLGSVDLALETFRNHKKSWAALMRNGMQKDLSWDKAAEQYEQIFEWAMMDPPARYD